MRINKTRGRDFASGYHNFEIRSGGLAIFPRLVAAEYGQVPADETIGTGIEALDRTLDGGLSRGSSTLLLGSSGTGKSTVALQILLAAAERGERSLLFSFDEQLPTILKRARGIGLPLERHLEDGAVQIRQMDPAEVSIGEFSHLVKTAVEKDDVRFLAIDSLSGYAFAMPDEDYLSVHLYELNSYLTQRAGSSFFIQPQSGLRSQSSPRFDISYVADSVIRFRHFESNGEVRKAISVSKSRSRHHESTIRELKIGPEGVQVGEPLKQFQGLLTGLPSYQGEASHGEPRQTDIPDAS